MDRLSAATFVSAGCVVQASFGPLAFAGRYGVAAPPPSGPARGAAVPAAQPVAPPVEAPRKVVLHVGCGAPNPEKLHQSYRNPAWREVRLDIDPGVKPDIVASMTDMQSVPAGFADAVWSSHNVEHLEEHEVALALREFLRVLKPGGHLLVTVPDLQAVAALVVEDKLMQPAYISPAGPIRPLDIIFGLSASIASGNRFMAHRTGFSADSLREALEGAGFVRVNAESKGLNLWASGFKPAPGLSALKQP